MHHRSGLDNFTYTVDLFGLAFGKLFTWIKDTMFPSSNPYLQHFMYARNATMELMFNIEDSSIHIGDGDAF